MTEQEAYEPTTNIDLTPFLTGIVKHLDGEVSVPIEVFNGLDEKVDLLAIDYDAPANSIIFRLVDPSDVQLAEEDPNEPNAE